MLLLAFGLAIGSFLNACIYRLPRQISLLRPSSSCPNCSKEIKPWDNVPVLSYILLFGKCRNCGAGISLRYPFVELLNGVLYVMAGSQFGIGWHLGFILFFISAMVLITFIDIDFQIIPDVITLPGIAIGLAGSAFIMPDPFLVSSFRSIDILSSHAGLNTLAITGIMNAVYGLVLGGGLYYLIAVLSRGGMGGGDIKLMAMVGSFMGWKAVLLTTFAGSLTGSLFGIFLMIFKGKNRKTKIPFGPFLAAGALITLFFGNAILTWYLN
ncbi:MAG: prepilin peptidase [Dissulfurispiraceae bacterium]|nr:prepilin peptidase [Dissulfurispiraceae bacterium]